MQASSRASWHTRRVDDTKTEEPGSLPVAPPPPHPRDNWFEIIEAGAVGGFTGAFGNDVYSRVKAAFQAAVKKFRDQRPNPDEEAEWVPGNIAIYEHFIYGPIREALDAVACDLALAGYLVPDPRRAICAMRRGVQGVTCTGCSWRTAQWRRLLRMAGWTISTRRVSLMALPMTVAGCMSVTLTSSPRRRTVN